MTIAKTQQGVFPFVILPLITLHAKVFHLRFLVKPVQNNVVRPARTNPVQAVRTNPKRK